MTERRDSRGCPSRSTPPPTSMGRVRKVGDGGELAVGRAGQKGGGGVAVDEFEHPALREVLDEEGQFGERQSQEVVELVDQAGALPDRGLESGGDLAQRAQFRRQGG